MASQPLQVSVTAPVHPAIERVKTMLFRPFDLGKWFVVGFCAWLARLGQPGFFSGFNHRFPSSAKVPTSHDNFSASLAHGRDWVAQNLHWILPLALALVCIVLALWVLFTWLSSRGEFMFLHCVALDRAEVEVPWKKYAREAHSLFLFRLALGLVGLAALVVFLAIAGVAAVRIIRRGAFAPGDVAGLALAGLALAAFSIVVLVVAKLTADFVVPIMFLRGGTWRAGWAELRGLFAGRAGLLVVYLLFQIVLALAIGALVLVVVIGTCCLAGCLMLIPYLGTVALLPVLAFKRSYSLCYLAQLGAQYDLFRQAAAPPPAS